MITVVGGVYREVCAEPSRDELYGSGGRAAAALVDLEGDVALHTFYPEASWAAVQAVADSSEFKVHLHDASTAVRFDYAHGLSRPVITPPLHHLTSRAHMRVEADHVLRYGMLEGDAVVDAAAAVYDPQNVDAPEHYRAGGSTAGRLAYVLNRSEARQLSGLVEPEAMVRMIAAEAHVDALVLKMGAQGALVFEDGTITQVPAFRTPRVWPIGSGDVFSAVFAHYWMTETQPAAKAARRASLATAHYCHTTSLPVPADLADDAYPPIEVRREAARPGQVYLAGPFFTLGERWVIDQARTALRDVGFKVFSPLHDVGHGPADSVVELDIQGILDSDLVFAVVDGLDAGTLFEVGYARALGKPVVAFRQNATDESMKMLAGTGCLLEPDFVTAVYATMWAALES